MAFIDAHSGTVVLRIVYSGPPLAGKTTNVCSLASALSASRRSEVFSPGEERGRTVYFDWLDYVGGLFDGRQVRCQIVSVPGQPELAGRRRHLIATADAVILVVDAREEKQADAVAALRECREILERKGVPVGIVLQANKHDLQGALRGALVRQQLALSERVGVVEAVATRGIGVRETFVFSVRLALDRARELQVRGELEELEVEVNRGEDLLAVLEALPSAPAPETGGVGAVHDCLATAPSARAEALSRGVVIEGRMPPVTRPASVAPAQGTRTPAQSGEGSSFAPPAEPPDIALEGPRLPGPDVPTGMVWPAVTGRILLQELAQQVAVGEASCELRVGNWALETEDFRVRSFPCHAYQNADTGRRALLELARQHAATGGWLESGRAVALVDGEAEGCRIWQVVKRRPSLAGVWESWVELPSAAAVAHKVALTMTVLERALDAIAKSRVLTTVDLESVTAIEPWSLLGFVGAPHESLRTDPAERTTLVADLLRRMRPRMRTSIPRFLDELERLCARGEIQPVVLDELRAALAEPR